MAAIGKGIALAALIAGAVVLEVNNKPADGVWLLIVICALLGVF